MIKTISLEHIVSQLEGNITSDMDGEKVMLSIPNGKYYNLGSVGGKIWDQIKEPKSIKALINCLIETYDVGEEECKKQVLSFLNMLLEENLIKIYMENKDL
ncbi:lasso peptide biosynthesis PqqD family chaperone [Neobacillus citreus]|uniref:Lasso peptide biosynthesis PqqD family chaperone n=1 Tax=Neobacillus citreus TaxID=2833578 RepID=A0A942YAG2_9BACI|nr:lasso peptide biosynthesis PqqD family chaperone [Neobacillus citreus]MCH6266016.1 lasso peptide biosynthesis PqqD family chaperone [Neobacillus citreus]